ncbi:MAG: pentapeptide repeat-containing protein [Bacteroidetes bacterium]|nr:pentapeptide repeat-containing protein [Bacteroidota bacterium]MBU1718054.1 pentapeptide repeat-containing protein [Bacteroidota bacterium]
MKLSGFSIKKIARYSESRHKAFYYHYYSASQAEFEKATERWKGKNDDLKQILAAIMEDKADWYKNEILNDQKNLSGTEFKDVYINQSINALDYTNLTYCTFDTCQFITEQTETEDHHDAILFECKVNHCLFKDCRFENVSFGGGDFQDIVFYNCTFDHVAFNKNRDGRYRRLFFQNCHFRNVDLTNIQLEDSCFWGECTFNKLLYSNETISLKRIVGKEIIARCKEWDKETFAKRDELKYIGGPHNKIEIVYFREDEKDAIVVVKKYSSTINCYEGLSRFYKYLFMREDQEGEHFLYLYFNYLYSWVEDQRKNCTKGVSRNLKFLFSRYILGYGVKAQRPLFAYLIMLFSFAFVYLFTGINHRADEINRAFNFDFSDFGTAVGDYLKCLYYSTITSTTIGYGDDLPASGLTMFFAGLEGILGILLMTMFTVIFGRRFFK